MKNQMILPSFMIKDDSKCERVSIACGFGTEAVNTVDDLCKITGEPSSMTNAAILGERGYFIQYFCGFEGEREKGWLVLGYDSSEQFLMHLPYLLTLLEENGGAPLLFSDKEVPCVI